MRKLILFLFLPFLVHASDQDQIVMEDLNKSARAFDAAASTPREVGENGELKTSFRIGAGLGAMVVADLRSENIYASGGPEDEKLRADIASALRIFVRLFTNFVGSKPSETLGALPGGVFDSALYARVRFISGSIGVLKKDVENRSYRLSVRHENSPRTLLLLSQHLTGLTFAQRQIEETLASQPEAKHVICVNAGLIETYGSAIKSDAEYLAKESGSESSAQLLLQIDEIANRSKFGSAFCGLGPPQGGLVAGSVNEALRSAVTELGNGLSSVQRQLQPLLTK